MTDNPQPDENISNPVARVHHYVLKGSGLSCWAECDAPLVGMFGVDAPFDPRCGHKLAGDNGPIVGSRAKVERAMP